MQTAQTFLRETTNIPKLAPLEQSPLGDGAEEHEGECKPLLKFHRKCEVECNLDHERDTKDCLEHDCN